MGLKLQWRQIVRVENVIIIQRSSIFGTVNVKTLLIKNLIGIVVSILGILALGSFV